MDNQTVKADNLISKLKKLRKKAYDNAMCEVVGSSDYSFFRGRKEMCDELISLVEEESKRNKGQGDFEETVKPVVRWLNQNHHPHKVVIISAVGAEILEGQRSISLIERL